LKFAQELKQMNQLVPLAGYQTQGQMLVELVMVEAFEEPVMPTLVGLLVVGTDDEEMSRSRFHPPLPGTERENRQYRDL
jgi:hypothetical protein